MTDVVAQGASPRPRRSYLAAAANPRVAITLLVVLAMTMFIVPLPVLLIDFMVGMNLLLAIYLLLKTLFVKDSLHLSTFPSMLLLTTVFRLAVSIATTRAILANGDAGDLVRTFGEFVVGGNVIVGLVVFFVISIVQFLVIMKGGERIAEVSARFTLDALPGKQMSIDADLKAGDITREEARARRKRLSSESEFFGSMDGAMRFVKGDCMATMLIVAVNLIGGILIGLSGGLSFDAAVRTYSILSVGDGLAAQIPSILSCVAAGVLATRVNSEESSEQGVGGDIAGELLRERKSLLVAGLIIGGLALMPGFPTLVLAPIAVVIFLALLTPWALERWRGNPVATAGAPEAAVQAEAAEPLAAAKYNDPIRVLIHPDDMGALERSPFGAGLAEKLRSAASDLGYALHAPKFAAAPHASVGVLSVELESIRSARTTSIDMRNVGSAVDWLVDVSRTFSANAFGLDDMNEWLEGQAQNFPRLVASVQGQVPGPILASVLRRLLGDGLSIAHPRALLEAIVAAADDKFTVDELTDVARGALVKQIAARNSDGQGKVPLVELSTESVASLNEGFGSIEAESLDEFEGAERMLSLLVAALVRRVDELRQAHGRVVLVVPGDMRSRLVQQLRLRGCDVAVISVPEADQVPEREIIAKIDLEQR